MVDTQLYFVIFGGQKKGHLASLGGGGGGGGGGGESELFFLDVFP